MSLRSNRTDLLAMNRSICHLTLWKSIDYQGVRNKRRNNRFFTIPSNGLISIAYISLATEQIGADKSVLIRANPTIEQIRSRCNPPPTLHHRFRINSGRAARRGVIIGTVLIPCPMTKRRISVLTWALISVILYGQNCSFPNAVTLARQRTRFQHAGGKLAVPGMSWGSVRWCTKSEGREVGGWTRGGPREMTMGYDLRDAETEVGSADSRACFCVKVLGC